MCSPSGSNPKASGRTRSKRFRNGIPPGLRRGWTWPISTVPTASASSMWRYWRPTHKGLAAQVRLERHERKKHTRYPGPRLIPFVLDVRGLWGKEAFAWAHAMVRRQPKAERAAALQDLRWRVSHALQLAVAEQCLRALRPTKRSHNPLATTPTPCAEQQPADQPPAAQQRAAPAVAAAPAPRDGCDVPVPECAADTLGLGVHQEDSGPAGEGTGAPATARTAAEPLEPQLCTTAPQSAPAPSGPTTAPVAPAQVPAPTAPAPGAPSL